MVKFGKNKFKAISKKLRKTNAVAESSNKILKKKQNVERKVTFQKEVLFKEAVKSGNELIKNVSAKDVISESKKSPKKEPKAQEINEPKLKPVEKQKKRQKTQISDTKLLLNLMKKK